MKSSTSRDLVVFMGICWKNVHVSVGVKCVDGGWVKSGRYLYYVQSFIVIHIKGMM